MENLTTILDPEQRLKISESAKRILEAKLKNQLHRYERLEEKSQKAASAIERKLSQEQRKSDLLMSQLQDLEEILLNSEGLKEESEAQLSAQESQNADLEQTLARLQKRLTIIEEELREKHKREIQVLSNEHDNELLKLRRENQATQERFSKMLQARSLDCDRLNDELRRLKVNQWEKSGTNSWSESHLVTVG